LEKIDLNEAVDAVRAGGLIAFPTDTFYALGVDAMNGDAICRAFEAKRRPATVPMPVLIAETLQIFEFTSMFDTESLALADRFWPGALTIVVEAREEVPAVLTGGFDTVGLRMPDHELARRLIAEAGCGITGTSANISGQLPSKDWRNVEASMGEVLDAIVVGECGAASSASTVVRIAEGSIHVLREGPVSAEQLEQELAVLR
jgi:L-threonylcarbamoyladenylate synthase